MAFPHAPIERPTHPIKYHPVSTRINNPDEPPPGGTHYSEPRACRAAVRSHEIKADIAVPKSLLKALHDFDRFVRRAAVDDDDLVSSVVFWSMNDWSSVG